ncbi:MAG: ribosome-associated translation inhibitor RaiA [Pyrinomonadaceae bacterium]
MKFEYTGRHMNVTPAMRTHVKDHFKKLEHLFDGTEARAHIIIDVEKDRQNAEVLVHWRDHTMTAKHTDGDMYQALSRAISKIEAQALKAKNKSAKKKGKARLSSVAPVPDGGVDTIPGSPRIMMARRYAIKPMTAEEAALRLSGEKDQFLVFRDSDTDRLGVLYKRKDGNYGLIEP